MARKINVKLIMELRDAGLSRSTIASTRHISRHSVSEVFNIANEKGIRYDDVRALEEPEVYRLFYPEKFASETMYGDPDYEHVHQELKRVGVTLRLLHEEYVERGERSGEIPMGKTKFNERYAEFTIANRLTNHLEHKPGERAEVDWSGPTMLAFCNLHDSFLHSGQIISGLMVLVTGAAITGALHEILPFHIQFAQAVDYNVDVDIPTVVVAVHVGADQSLVSGEEVPCKFQTQLLRTLSG